MRLNKWTSIESRGIEMCINGEILWIRQLTCGFCQMLEMTHEESVSVSNTTLFQLRSHARSQYWEKRLLSSSRLSVRQSVRPSKCNNWDHAGRIFVKFGILGIFFFGYPSRKFELYWKLTIAGTSHEDLHALMTSPRWIPLRMGNFSEKNYGENQNTIMFNTFSRESYNLCKKVRKIS